LLVNFIGNDEDTGYPVLIKYYNRTSIPNGYLASGENNSKNLRYHFLGIKYGKYPFETSIIVV